MKLSEIANRVINLAGRIRDYYATELPKRHPNYPLIGLNEENTPPPPEEKELREFFATIPDEMLYQLILIMYLGRGDYGTDDLLGNYESFKNTFRDREHVVSQMLGKAPLADYLLDGLAELRNHNLNVDGIPLK